MAQPDRYTLWITTAARGSGAQVAGQTLTRRISVPRHGMRQLILYFDTRDEVGPEREPAFPFSPYGGTPSPPRQPNRHPGRPCAGAIAAAPAWR